MKTTLYCRELRAVYGPSPALTPPAKSGDERSRRLRGHRADAGVSR